MTPYRQDYHIHTGFSMDSDAQMEAVCRVAVSKGIDEIAFTDHLDFGPDDAGDPFPAEEYLEAVQHCRQRFGHHLDIRAGIEIGEPHVFAGEAAAVLSDGAFDVVLGSAHYASGLQAAWLERFFEQPLREAYHAYFEQVNDLASKGDFDVLGHLDLVKRDARRFGLPYDGPEPYADVIRAALRAVVERGKGIELNTSPLRRGQPEPCPSLEILRWYRELGGEILTLGSDAHTSEAVGSYLELGMDLCRMAGFRRLASFRRRKIEWKEI